MKLGRKFLIVVTFALFAVAPLEVSAQNEKPSGKIKFSTMSVGVGIGGEWGRGTLTLNNGKRYKIKIWMFRVGMVGVESIDAKGTVFNLRRVRDIEGVYASGSAGLTVGGGLAGEAMKNNKDVVIKLSSTQLGLAGKIAASGVTISLAN